MSERLAEAAEIDHLAQVWYDGWQDAHARIWRYEKRLWAGPSADRH